VWGTGLAHPGAPVALEILASGPHIGAAAPRPISCRVALDLPHLDLGVAHHYHELAEASAHFIRLT